MDVLALGFRAFSQQLQGGARMTAYRFPGYGFVGTLGIARESGRAASGARAYLRVSR
jgi:hypothetical protein